ncbi:hypothetical protein HDV05_000877 [Chytridiales sp. JEL 0842]|nr:hypothetical protein HDV05_000877 [Chytridiales sp. JEL 0842]
MCNEVVVTDGDGGRGELIAVKEHKPRTSLWDLIPNDIYDHILDYSDALTQYLNKFGCYSPENLDILASRQLGFLYKKVWRAAFVIDWAGPLKDLPLPPNQEHMQLNWVDLTLISSRRMYDALIQISNGDESGLSVVDEECVAYANGWHELVAQYRKQPEDQADYASIYGQLHYVIQLESQGTRIGEWQWEQLLGGVILLGRLDDLKYLHQVRKMTWSDDMFQHAPESRSLELFKYMYVQRTYSVEALKQALNCACKFGSLSIVTYLFNKGVAFPTEQQAFGYALLMGHLNVLRLLHENLGMPLSPLHLHTAMESSFVNIVAYMVERGVCLTDHKLLNEMALRGDLKIVEFFIRSYGSRSDVVQKAFYRAFQYGQLEVAKMMHRLGITPIPVENLMIAVTKGHFDVAKYFYIDVAKSHEDLLMRMLFVVVQNPKRRSERLRQFLSRFKGELAAIPSFGYATGFLLGEGIVVD